MRDFLKSVMDGQVVSIKNCMEDPRGNETLNVYITSYTTTYKETLTTFTVTFTEAFVE